MTLDLIAVYWPESMLILIVGVGQHLTDPQQWKVIFQSMLGRYQQQTVASSYYTCAGMSQKEQRAKDTSLRNAT